ncbi:NUDIX hydrolase [Marinimicrococcus flavescens]|uniref:NUDIX hydrolase n=1 Tax=Marinimicrococcus flavescens TaxID=3031815 RepID=A0AAP3UZ42_9PROT|nr:NUDIX hydrolase [Marinimicrococcus flavescens]
MTALPEGDPGETPPGPARAVADLSWRLAYRVAHRLLRLWWRLRRPPAEGASVAVWREGRLLVVRTSYRRLLELPAGGRRPHETAREAALRELREETGLVAPAEALEGPLRLEFTSEHRRIVENVFTWRPSVAPVPRVDRREIVAALFVAPGELAGRTLAPNLALYLEAACRPDGMAASADHGTSAQADTVAQR